MSFSAAQMDPERVRMGEQLKNVGILGTGGLCYLFGFFLTYTWFQQVWRVGNAGLGNAGPVLLRNTSRSVSREGFGDVSCLRAKSGNLQQQPDKPPWHRGLFGAADKKPKRSAVESMDGQHSRLITLLSCGMIAWPRGRERGAQPTLARSDSQVSGELGGVPTCARLMA